MISVVVASGTVFPADERWRAVTMTVGMSVLDADGVMEMDVSKTPEVMKGEEVAVGYMVSIE